MQETLLALSEAITTTSTTKKKKPEEKTAAKHSRNQKEEAEVKGEIVVVQNRSSVGSRRVAPTFDDVALERALPNGDLYTGTFSGNVPHGRGRYLWSDGCVYEGEWRKGKASGKGKFSWPSGATYEGDFRSGQMDGIGTFTGTNGDVYEGKWRCNLKDGEGKYVWKNGNIYEGEWKNGIIFGEGVMIWSNGNRFEGAWDEVKPAGGEDFEWKRSSLDGGKISSSFNLNVPRICIWESDGEDGDITCDIIDNLEKSILYRNKRDSDYVGGSKHLQRSTGSSFAANEVKKPGQTISKGHKNYDLMLNLQLGIRYSVGKHGSILRELRITDFDPKEKFWTRFSPEGSKFTPPHQSVDFRWKDYHPMVFRHLRELFGVDPADYMLAICGNDALRELSSPGKSGSFFYLTQDDRFMIKTVKKSEVKVLLRMLPSYYEHVCQYKNTLVTKFFGVHCVKPMGGPKTRFIVMGNIFCSKYRIHKRFDLKGSSYGRITDKSGGEIDETTTLKDLDLNYTFRLQRSWYRDFIRQIDIDCEYLEAERIMDYSLLIGVHFCGDFLHDSIETLPFCMNFGKRDGNYDDPQMQGYHHLFMAELLDMDPILNGWNSDIRLGANMPARAEHVSRAQYDQSPGTACDTSPRHQNGGEITDAILYCGIIDILQDYDISKKLEHAYKSLQVDPKSISAVDPRLYSKRFRDFIHKIFILDN